MMAEVMSGVLFLLLVLGCFTSLTGLWMGVALTLAFVVVSLGVVYVGALLSGRRYRGRI